MASLSSSTMSITSFNVRNVTVNITVLLSSNMFDDQHENSAVSSNSDSYFAKPSLFAETFNPKVWIDVN